FLAPDWRFAMKIVNLSPPVQSCVARDLAREGAIGQVVPAAAKAPKSNGNGADQDCGAAHGIVSRFNPPIRFTSAEPHIIADEAEKAIIKAGFPLFHRGGTLVEPIIEKVPTYGGGWTQTVTLRDLGQARLIDLMSQAAGWEKYNIREKKYLAAAPPTIGAEILLARAGHWAFPRISGVIAAPTLRPDGSILTEPGYDPETQLYHAMNPNLILPLISEKPTKEEAF